MLFSIGLYLRLIGVSLRAQMEYRLGFLFDLLGVLLGTFIAFGSLALIFQRFGNLGGWSLWEIAFLYGLVETAFATTDMLFSGFDPDTFGPLVQRGALDQMLLRPASVTTQILGSDLALRRLSRIAQGLGVLLLAVAQLNVAWTPAKLVYLPVVCFSQIAFFGGLFVIGSTSTFWTVQRVEIINIFTYGGTEMMAYPMHIYTDWMRRFFTYIVPAIFLNYYPALYFLNKPDPLGLPPFAPYLAPLAGLGVLAAAACFWRFGLRHYSSTGT